MTATTACLQDYVSGSLVWNSTCSLAGDINRQQDAIRLSIPIQYPLL
jgi:hypothetical protein